MRVGRHGGGELLEVAFKLLGELVDQTASTPPPEEMVAGLREGLAGCVDEEQTGRPRLTVTLPDRGALEQLARTLARLLVASQPTIAERDRRLQSEAIHRETPPAACYARLAAVLQ
jgi:hypothetical protein